MLLELKMFLRSKVEHTGYNRHFKYFKKLLIPKISIDEQKRIIHELELIDNLISNRGNLINELVKLKEIKMSKNFE